MALSADRLWWWNGREWVPEPPEVNRKLDIVAFILSLVCVFTPFSVPVSATLAIVYLVRNRGRHSGKGYAIAGLVISGTALLLWAAAYILATIIMHLCPNGNGC